MTLKNGQLRLYSLIFSLIALPCVFLLTLPLYLDLGAEVSFWFKLPSTQFLTLFSAFVFLIITVAVETILIKKINTSQAFLSLDVYSYSSNKEKGIRNIALFFITMLFFINCLRHYQLFPFMLVGEWNVLLDKANMINSMAAANLKELWKIYNLGFSPIYVLLKPIIGDSLTAIKLFYICMWSISIIGLCLLLLRKHPMFWPGIILLTPAIINSLSLMSLRQFKWHGAAVTATFALVYAVSKFQKPDGDRKLIDFVGVGLSLALLIFCIFLYHGNIIFLPILIVILSYSTVNKLLHQNKKYVYLLIGIISIILISIAGLIYHGSFFLQRITDALFHNEFNRTIPSNLHSYMAIFFKYGISPPLAVVFIIGLGSSIYRFNESWFARAILITFSSVMAALSITYGLTVIDENNYLLLSFIGVLLLGFLEIYNCVRCIFTKNSYVAIICILISAILSYFETQHYYLYKNKIIAGEGLISPYENNLAALSLTDIRNKISKIQPSSYFFPSKDLAIDNGGFTDKDFYFTPYFSKELNSVGFYVSLKDLSERITAELKKSPTTPIFVYYNPSFDMYKALNENRAFTVRKVELAYPNVWTGRLAISYLYVYLKDPQPNLLEPPPPFNEKTPDDEDIFYEIDRFSKIVNNK